MRGHSTRIATRMAERFAAHSAARIAALGVALATVAVIVTVAAVLIPFADMPAAVSQATGARPAPAPPRPVGARLDMVLHEGNARGSASAEVALACLPTGGNHPYRAEACRSLEQVDGKIESLSVVYGRTCQMIVDPVTITVDGYWNHRAINYEKTFPNRCFAERVANKVFNFF